ncbi:MAG TPA: hypothetical protein VGF92_19095, partial [Stellaceae bacterium]
MMNNRRSRVVRRVLRRQSGATVPTADCGFLSEIFSSPCFSVLGNGAAQNQKYSFPNIRPGGLDLAAAQHRASWPAVQYRIFGLFFLARIMLAATPW